MLVRRSVLTIAAALMPLCLDAHSGAAQAAASPYAAVDAFVDAAPRSAEQSVPALAAYLARSGRDDLTRTRAIYRWVTRHVAYDVPGFLSGNYGDLTPDGVLRRRAAVCDGYSRLTQVLGAAMGLQVAMIKGWSKGYGYNSGDQFTGPMNHSWNAVMIDGQWRLMDVTWGSGYLDDKTQFVRAFQEHYFLTRPEDFVFDHLPGDPTWQLLPRVVSSAEFGEMVDVRPMFFAAGLSLLSDKRAHITATDRATITLGVTKPVEMVAQVVDATTDQPARGEYAFVQVNDERAEITAAFPHAGNWVVRLFAKHLGAEGPLDWVLDYSVKATRGSRQGEFPTPYATFGRSGVWIIETPTGVMEVGKTYQIRLRAPGAREMLFVSGETRIPLVKNGDEFSAALVAASGESVLYGKFGSSEKLMGLLRYVGK
jgi:hypothetical protein